MNRLGRIALGVEYDGSNFHGWQKQPMARSVQGELEKALAVIAGVAVDVVAAGRTDSGVHASGQVVHADISVERPLTAWVRGVNSYLPSDLAVRWAAPVDAGFHARFSATGRHYRYLLLNRAVRPAIAAGRVGWAHRPLNEQLMQQAADLLLGRHDFSSFRAAECQAKTAVRELRGLRVLRQDDLLTLDFHADAFLQHMVRNLVGALVSVGQGARQPTWIAELLAARDRRLAAPTFSPAGLYLSRVDYDAGWKIPAPETTGALL